MDKTYREAILVDLRPFHRFCVRDRTVIHSHSS